MSERSTAHGLLAYRFCIGKGCLRGRRWVTRDLRGEKHRCQQLGEHMKNRPSRYMTWRHTGSTSVSPGCVGRTPGSAGVVTAEFSLSRLAATFFALFYMGTQTW